MSVPGSEADLDHYSITSSARSRNDSGMINPSASALLPRRKAAQDERTVHEGKTLLYRASKQDCDLCPLNRGAVRKNHRGPSWGRFFPLDLNQPAPWKRFSIGPDHYSVCGLFGYYDERVPAEIILLRCWAGAVLIDNGMTGLAVSGVVVVLMVSAFAVGLTSLAAVRAERKRSLPLGLLLW